ncbi:MAG: LysR family transcriptional regulator [Myxococcaceae bacterium]
MSVPEFGWDDLRYLEAIDRTGNVRAAAREGQIAVSTLYRRVATLEARLGERCLVRGESDGSLTPLGRSLAQLGRRVRSGLSEVFGELRASESSLAGTVSLTTVEALLPLLRAPLAQLTQAHPGLCVELHLGDSGPSVRKRQVDVALGVMKRPPEACWGRKVGKLDAGVFGTAEAVRGPRRWVLRSLDEASSPESAWEREHAVSVAVRAPFHALVSLVAAGAGVGLMPRLLGAHHGLTEVESLRTTTAHLTRPLWVLTHEGNRKSPRVQALCSALTGAFQHLA